MLNMDVKIK